MKKENGAIRFENQREIELLKIIIEIANYGNFLTAEERTLSHELSKILNDMHVTE